MSIGERISLHMNAAIFRAIEHFLGSCSPLVGSAGDSRSTSMTVFYACTSFSVGFSLRQ